MPRKRPEDRKVRRTVTLDPELWKSIEELRGNETVSAFVNRILSAVIVPPENYYRLETLMREVGHANTGAMLKHILYEAIYQRLKEDR